MEGGVAADAAFLSARFRYDAHLSTACAPCSAFRILSAFRQQNAENPHFTIPFASVRTGLQISIFPRKMIEK
jgi:hypothetical protein